MPALAMIAYCACLGSVLSSIGARSIDFASSEQLRLYKTFFAVQRKDEKVRAFDPNDEKVIPTHFNQLCPIFLGRVDEV